MKMKINTNGETNNNGSVPVTIATVEYETREASAKANKDFKYTNGTLVCIRHQKQKFYFALLFTSRNSMKELSNKQYQFQL